MKTDVTNADQVRWLKTQQQYARNRLRDAERMPVALLTIPEAQAELVMITAVLQTVLDAGEGLPLFRKKPLREEKPVCP